ncbi:Rha family transcriptional regulator [Paenibacillus larvae]|nr:Rha family transcriptional regulator [Paenibacillus larvae]MDT2295482.1 Rha family transcriptional regulator [Paenibacillus larvae]
MILVERNFASVDYLDAKGESRKKVVMSQDGFSFLVMGYTGKDAARFKKKCILQSLTVCASNSASHHKHH